MKQYIEHDLIMLLKKEHAIIGDYYLTKDNKITKCDYSTLNLAYNNVQHLYITSNDEIKKGDWYYTDEKSWNIDKAVLTNLGIIGEKQLSPSPIPRNLCKKIIATTDKSLFVIKEYSSYLEEVDIPQISQQFIEYFITEYNKGNILTKVLVEYEEYYSEVSNEEYNYIVNTLGIPFKDFKRAPEIKLIINPDNTINIKPVEVKMYSREEVIIKFIEMIKNNKAVHVQHDGTDNIIYRLTPNYKWIEENL